MALRRRCLRQQYVPVPSSSPRIPNLTRLNPLFLVPVFIYPAKQAPNYKIGYKAALAFALASIGFTTLFWYLAKNDK